MLDLNDDCKHATVRRCNDENEHYVDMWVCEECGDEFGPLSQFATEVAALEEQSDGIIDMATSMFSAVIWDLHQRAYEAKQVTEPPPGPKGFPGMERIADTICREKGHKRGGDGVCERCGDSPFLGA